MKSQDENDLISKIQKDDPEAFENLYHLYHKRVFAFASRIMPSNRDAEEIVQNVFMAVWYQRKTIRISTSFSSYLFGITRHMVYDLIQQKIRHEAFVEYFLEQNKEYDINTEDDVLFHELSEEVQRLMLDLPQRRREIFILSRMEGLSYQEISKKLGISENTVDTQIRHALRYLRDKISSYKN
jgi:RNA polymerase sigma-70 factor, ECF subfamily